MRIAFACYTAHPLQRTAEREKARVNAWFSFPCVNAFAEKR